MAVYEYQFTVNASLQEVREFHYDTSALQRLIPLPVIVQLHKIEPLCEDSLSVFTLWVGPLPIKWKAVHRNVSEQGFTDVQVEGPAAKWEHTHQFVSQSSDRTEIHEHIEYEHRSGLWGLITRVLFAKANLWVLFTYRKWVTRRLLSRR